MLLQKKNSHYNRNKTYIHNTSDAINLQMLSILNAMRTSRRDRLRRGAAIQPNRMRGRDGLTLGGHRGSFEIA